MRSTRPYGDRDYQAEAMDRFRLRADLGDTHPYVPESRSEAITLANLARRGVLHRERIGGRWCYTLPPELTERIA